MSTREMTSKIIDNGADRQITVFENGYNAFLRLARTFTDESLQAVLYVEQLDALIEQAVAVRNAVYGARTVEAAKPARSVTTLSPQAALVLKHLKSKGSITNVEANAVHKVRALPRRISDLKALGFKITREFSKDLTGQRYVRYSLAA